MGVILRIDSLSSLGKLCLDLLLLQLFLFKLLVLVLLRDLLLVDQHGFVLLKLLNVTVQGLDLVLGLPFHFVHVLEQNIVVHFEVTFVAHPNQRWVILRQLTLALAADFADGASAPLAVALQVAIHQLQL